MLGAIVIAVVYGVSSLVLVLLFMELGASVIAAAYVVM